MPITAILLRRSIKRFQINTMGKRPIVRSVAAAPMLYRYATASNPPSGRQRPLGSERAQKKETGEHWKMVQKRKTNPNAAAVIIAP